MPHEIFVDDTVVIRRKIEVPERCSRCKRHYKLGDTVLKTLVLRPKEETVHLSTLLEGETKHEVVSVKDSYESANRPERLILEVRCLACGHIHLLAHNRLYRIQEMDRLMAFKLRGLLYDSNVLDPMIKKKCFDETEGYHGDCVACNIEAEIGTEEVPHPIDLRVHTCKGGV